MALTYEALKKRREQEWKDKMKLREARLTARQEELAKMPDELMRPDPSVDWRHPWIKCPCGGLTFRVGRWVTVNGIRHRFEATCIRCNEVRTWDWSEQRWLDR
jgi:hypothetical protein